MFRISYKTGLGLLAILLFIISFSTGCSCSGSELDREISGITAPYRFQLFSWEVDAFFNEMGKLFKSRSAVSDSDTDKVLEFFSSVRMISSLITETAMIKTGSGDGDRDAIYQEIHRLREENKRMKDEVERILETQIRNVLTEEGIRNPYDRYINVFNFPPVNFYLDDPPHLLVVSPRQRIESIKEVLLLPELSLEDIQKIEDETDLLGVSSLVVELGGIATYPSYVNIHSDLNYVINTAVEEWLHQYLAFTPLGFRYVLDITGIKRDYDIATVNETVAGIASREIGDKVYEKYYAQHETDTPGNSENTSGFDFHQEMRRIRIAVDDYLARGEIDQAEEYMKQKRDSLAENGYFIRKLNQAYFSFYGTYAHSPTSVSPIGRNIRNLRNRSTSIKDFLEQAAGITNLEELNAKFE